VNAERLECEFGEVWVDAARLAFRENQAGFVRRGGAALEHGAKGLDPPPLYTVCEHAEYP